jgi:hypothetical protein
MVIIHLKESGARYLVHACDQFATLMDPSELLADHTKVPPNPSENWLADHMEVIPNPSGSWGPKVKQSQTQSQN